MMDSSDRSETADESRGHRPEAVAPPRAVNRFSAPRIARTSLVAVLLGHALLTVASILTSELSAAAEALGLILLPPLLVLQFFHCLPCSGGRSLPLICLTLTVQGLLTFLPLMLFQAFWQTMAGYLAGSLLLLLPPRAAWPLYTALVLGMLTTPLLYGRSLAESAELGLTTLLTGLVMYTLTRLSQLISLLHTTRGELARQAVTGERLRFARDLHDLLGFSLSAITLKSELVHQLIPTQPGRALKEVDEILTIAGQSLTDVRKAASGYRSFSLRQEIKTAQSMLHAAGVQVHTELSLGSLAPHIDTAFAVTLREAMTNLLRHSNATRCRIEAAQHDGWVRLVVENDGVDPAYHNAAPHSGNGLGNLRTRLSALGGRLESGRTEDGRFRLAAEAPVKAAGKAPTDLYETWFPPNGTAA